MIRNFKALGLALVAVFAMSALAATAASAAEQGFATSTGNFKLTGTDEATGNALTYPGEEKLVCPESHYVGEKENGGFLASGSKTFTVTPTYTNCSAGPNNHKATVTMNGCDFLFHLGNTKSGVTDTYAVTADLVCPAGKEVEVHVYFAAGNENIQVCKIKFGAQTGLGGATVKDLTNGTVTVGGTTTGIKASKSGICGAGETNAAEYDIAVILGGVNEGGTSTAVSLSD